MFTGSVMLSNPSHPVLPRSFCLRTISIIKNTCVYIHIHSNFIYLFKKYGSIKNIKQD